MTSGALARTASQVVRADFSPGRPRGVGAARGGHHLGDPVAGCEGRVGPLEDQRSRLLLPCNGFGDGVEPFAQ